MALQFPVCSSSVYVSTHGGCGVWVHGCRGCMGLVFTCLLLCGLEFMDFVVFRGEGFIGLLLWALRFMGSGSDGVNLKQPHPWSVLVDLWRDSSHWSFVWHARGMAP